MNFLKTAHPVFRMETIIPRMIRRRLVIGSEPWGLLVHVRLGPVLVPVLSSGLCPTAEIVRESRCLGSQKEQTPPCAVFPGKKSRNHPQAQDVAPFSGLLGSLSLSRARGRPSGGRSLLRAGL